MATKTTISTLRHARTVFHGEKRYAGSMDISLSETGIRGRAAGVYGVEICEIRRRHYLDSSTVL